MKQWIDKMVLRAAARLQAWQEDEQGMEIIQVLVLLAIGLGLVALFITFGKQITDAVSEKVAEFMDVFSGV